MPEPRDEPFCGHCGERLPPHGRGLGFCSRCARRYPGARPAERGAGARETRTIVTPWHVYPKDPLLAALLSVVLPGGGQLYNGHWIRAVFFFVTSPLVLPWILAVPEAFFAARRQNARHALAAAV